MHLYNVTIQSPTAFTHSLVGNFSGMKQQEILVCRGGGLLELLRVDANTGKVHSLLSHNVFGIVQSLIPVRLTGSSKDYLVVGSDSGSVVILEYNLEKNAFVKVHQEPFGKSGCRRITPGQYLAADPKGRAVMIAATEKQKFVYVLNRDAENHLTISSPLEAHKSHLITFAIVSVDVGFENPVFACLEFDYHDIDRLQETDENPSKVLSFYELDLGLNHVVRKFSEPVGYNANHLIPLPAGKEGPGGVLVCDEGRITWKSPGFNSIYVQIPKRADDQESRQDIIVCSFVHKMKGFFFVFAQTENGDIFKITCDYKNESVEELRIRYFDTVPVAVSINVLKAGFLIIASEFGNNFVFQIESLGDDNDEPEWSSSNMAEDASSLVFHRRKLANLTPVDELQSFSPIIQTKVVNAFNDDRPQIFSICGNGANSSFKVLRHGLEVTEIVSYPLPGSPNGVWGLKAKNEDPHHSYIVLSFINATLVLSVGEVVEEVTDSGFFLDGPTLNCFQVGEESLIQIQERGLRYIQSNGKISEWNAPDDQTVSHSTCNNKQIVLVLDSLEIVYFELDEVENLNEFEERRKLSSEITGVAIGPIPEGRQRSKFLAVGCKDQTIRLISLNPDSTLQNLGMQALNANPHSLLISELIDKEKDQLTPTYYLNVGLETGVLVRTVLDPITGTLSDSRSRYLGTLPVKLFRVQIAQSEAILAISSRPWLNYVFQKQFRLEPVTYDFLEYGSAFVSEQVPEGILAISGNSLRIMTIDNIGAIFNTISYPLKFTPRSFVYDENIQKFLIAETSHRMKCYEETEKSPVDVNGDDDQETERSNFNYKSLTRVSEGKWASLIRILDPRSGETGQIIDLSENETITAFAQCKFHVSPMDVYYVVASALEMKLAPRDCEAAFISVYRLNREGKLELLHKTEVETVVGALYQFQGRLLAGLGKTLRIYDLGRKKLLRKTETSVFPSFINDIRVQGDRIYICDIQHSVFMARYIYQENVIILFADDPTPRWITRFTVLDFNTICGCDKFGNIFIKRLTKRDIEELEDDISGVKMMHDKSLLNGAPRKLQQVCEFFVGDMVTSLERCTLVAGGREILLYTTLMGSIGLLIPFASSEDVELFTSLEMHMRQELPPLCGRDHLAFRSSYVPVKAVVDGDLIEQYTQLSWERRTTIAEEMERTLSEVSRQIELIRARVS